MSNLKKLNKILSDKKSTWKEEVKWREENEEWLAQSFDIAVKILDTLRVKKMTQKDLADKMNVSPQFINKIVKGQENLSLETLSKLSRALEIKLIKVIGHETHAMVEYDFEQAYEVSQIYRKQFFSQAASQGYVGLEACQVYVKEQTLEYKMQS